MLVLLVASGCGPAYDEVWQFANYKAHTCALKRNIGHSAAPSGLIRPTPHLSEEPGHSPGARRWGV